jgi:hypothetical protein
MDTIPNYQRKADQNLNVKTYLDELYNSTKTEYESKYKDKYLENMLILLQEKVKRYQRTYDRTYQKLLDPLLNALKWDEHYVNIKIRNDCDDSDETVYFDKAIQTFCSELTNKCYPLSISEESKSKMDFMDGNVTHVYKIIRITLK